MRKLWSIVGGLALFGAVLTAPAFAQGEMKDMKSASSKSWDMASWGFDLQYRVRFEYNEAKDFMSDTSAEFFSHRARLGAWASFEDIVKAYLQVQDVRYWGEELGTLSDYSADGLDLHQAFVVFNPKGPFSVKLGRQEVTLDEERLVGPVDWSQQGRSFDGMFFKYQKEKWSLSAGYAKLAEADARATTTGYDFDVFGLYANFQPTEEFYGSFLVLGDVDAAPETHKRWTVGPYLKFTSGGFHARLDAYYQFGTETATIDYAAFMVGARAGYTFMEASIKPTIDVWIDYLSGDDDAGDDKNEAFDTVFATNHRWYGYMDIFTNIPADTADLGLMDAGLGFKAEFTETLNGAIDLHFFFTNEDTFNENNDLGREVDLTLNYNWAKPVTFTGGLSAFAPGDAMEDLRGGDKTEMFGYVMANVML